MRRSYQERWLLRGLEGAWSGGERLLGRLIASPLNPLYELGTLSIFLLLVLTASGLYLAVIYRPGAEQAYPTMLAIHATWLGGLMRTIHRYAADGLILTVLLHALKMLLSDRFWGSRWLSWVSGWVLLGLIWSIGVMGYWLVWDQRAQWLTNSISEALGGQVALTFASADSLRQSSTFFIIVLFLHIFLPTLIVLGMLFHVMRLARPRILAPRLLLIEMTVALLILAIWRPVTLDPPFDPDKLVGSVTLDVWYLGFLPLAQQWGWFFWGPVMLVFMLLVALPWLARGRNQGPAVVIEDSCTGCTICVQECPYGAIEMRTLPEGSRYPALAVVNPDLCTSCGLCVGACATNGIDLPEVPAAIIREHLKRSIMDLRNNGRTPVVVFACQGHVAMGTLPVRQVITTPAMAPLPDASAYARNPKGLLIPLIDMSRQPGRVTPGFWGPGDDSTALPVLTCALPCVGMVQPEMIRDSINAGAGGVVVLTGPDHDCGFREGPHWLADRLDRRKSLVRQGVYVVPAITGDKAPLNEFLKRFAANQLPADQVGATLSPIRRIASFVSGLVVLLLIIGLAMALEIPATAGPATQGMVRIGLVHSGAIKHHNGELSDDIKLPEGVSAEQIVGGERFPVHIRLEIDGASVAEREYRPTGLRQEGMAYALESWPVAPGVHHVRVLMMEDGEHWRERFAGSITLETGQIATLIYDAPREIFVLQ